MEGIVERLGAFALVGLASGFASGLFGVGGGREPAGRLLLDDHTPVAGRVIPAK